MDMPLINLEFNEHGQPVGEEARTFCCIVGTLVRRFPICYEDWRVVPEDSKEKLIHNLKVF